MCLLGIIFHIWANFWQTKGLRFQYSSDSSYNFQFIKMLFSHILSKVGDFMVVLITPAYCLQISSRQANTHSIRP